MLLGNAAAPPVSPHYGSRAPRALSGTREWDLILKFFKFFISNPQRVFISLYPRVEFDIKIFFNFSYLTPRGSSYIYSRSGSLLKLLGCFQQLPLQGLHMFICLLSPPPPLLLSSSTPFCVLASAAAPTV